ncbi:MAG: ribosome small subunit-dependent GTPase A [Ignavibacteriales bacterium]|nr:MAG: ribosome small subunit-dependent GTPase A [Ignavibacteriales bacterium]
MFNLKQLGWNNFFENEFESYKRQGFSAGRIAIENKTNYLVYTEAGEATGECSGKLMFATEDNSDLPKAGDWVAVSLYDNNEKAVIHEVVNRHTKLSRKSPDKKVSEQVIAANIDIVFIVQALDDNFNINRLERYLTAVYQSGAKPVVVLNKSDLCPDVETKISKVKKIKDELDVVAVSAVDKTGISNLYQYISEGVTIAFIGSSGVGKSTLINLLLGEEHFKTNAIRESDSRGKHTTTHRELVLLPDGGMLIDTPGMRGFLMWSSQSSLNKTFDEFGEFAVECHFKDCTHIHETGCAVLQALNDGLIEEERYRNYLKLHKEVKYLETKTDKFAELEEKRKWKNIHKEIKRYFKDKDK